MSPEQAEMNNVDIDTRSDIYSLGAVLYELLTGTVPFSRKDPHAAAFPEMLRMIKEVEPLRPSTRLTNSGKLANIAGDRQTEPKKLIALVRGELDWIVLKSLEKDRKLRYETANELGLDMQRYLADESVVACPPSLAYRFRKLVRRHQGPVLAASLVFLALVGGMIGTTWNMMRATDAEEAARREANQKEDALKAAQQSANESKEQLFQALLNQARAGRHSRRPGQRLDSLAALARAAAIRPDERLRDEAIAAMALPDIRTVPGWRGTPPGAAEVAYGRSYRIWARINDRRTISIRSLPDDREIRAVDSGPIIGNSLSFSPDERFLVAIAEQGHTFRVWRVVDGRPLLQEKLRDCGSYTFSTDGKRVAVAQKDSILCFDIETEKEVNRWRAQAAIQSMAFNADDSRMAVGYFPTRPVSVLDTATGKYLASLPVGPMGGQFVAWQPHSDHLAVGGNDALIHIWNVLTKRKLATLEGHVHNVWHLTFHPDGEMLASHGWDGQWLLWDASSGRLLMRLASVSVPQFSPDGRRLGVTWRGDHADFLEVTPSREFNSLNSAEGNHTFRSNGNADISADGRMLAVGSDYGATLWDLRTGRELAKLPGHSPFVFFDHALAAPPWNLLTSGSAGLQNWSLTRDEADKMRLALGSPRQISPLVRACFARSPAGQTLAAATIEGGANQILDLETGAIRQQLGAHLQGEIKALSGDGRWAATSGWHSDRVKLWHVAKKEVANEWVLGKQTFVFFTPDSRALIVARGDEFSFWDVESRQLIHRLPRDVSQFPGWIAFSRDGRLMALEMAPGIIHLKDAITMRTFAKLEDPHGDRATWQGFTPDGAKLVVVSRFAGAVHIWDLKAIRTRLKDLNLDWD